VTSVRAIKVRPDRRAELPEHVATEEPMEIRVGGPGQEPTALAVTMRTPGHDFDLAAGFVITEGVADARDVLSVAYCDGPLEEAGRFNVVTVRLRHPWEPTGPARRFAASASCGLCGKSSIDEIEVACRPIGAAPPVAASVIHRLPDRLRQAQPAFDRTGGIHAAGLFDAAGDLVCAREDVGRHNAVDKVVGHHALRNGGPEVDPAGAVLMVSGRVSFEIVQKAAVAGVGTIAAVSAPSSLAVEAAARLGVAVVAFVRNGSFNVYSHPERLDLDA
jgi:FdhD protein